MCARGGKIAGENGNAAGGVDPRPASSGSSGASEPSWPFTPPTPSAAPSSGLGQPSGGHSVDDACAAICERNGQCGAAQSDCQERCTTEINGALSCSAQANAYIHCYANNLVDGCAALPPVCESDYCAYTICAGKVVPVYCRPR
jgi:hypothetical protein